MPAINLSAISKTVEKYMMDIATISRRGHETVMDPISLRVTESLVVIYNGKAFAGPMGNPVVTTVGAVPTTRQLYEVGVPVTVQCEPNDIIMFTVSADPALVGVPLIVDGEIPTTFFTHRRLQAHLDVNNDG